MDAPLSAKKTERHVSKKLWIKEVLGGSMQTGTDMEPNTLLTARGPASRINIIGIVIQREDMPVSTLIIDDGTGNISVRSFDYKLSQQIGVIVQVIGRPRKYQGEVYVTAEAVSVIDKGWAAFRKAELGPVQMLEAATEPLREEPAQNSAEKIIAIIRKLDEGNGAPIEQVILMSKILEAEEIIEQLLLHGDIFELRPGKVKVL